MDLAGTIGLSRVVSTAPVSSTVGVDRLSLEPRPAGPAAGSRGILDGPDLGTGLEPLAATFELEWVTRGWGPSATPAPAHSAATPQAAATPRESLAATEPGQS